MSRLAVALRPCAHCGDLYEATQEHKNYARKYCSRQCSADAWGERRRSKYPPREEIVDLYCTQGLSDREVGARYGHSYQWSLTVRRHYGIAASEKAEKPK